MRIKSLTLIAGAALALSGCAANGLGMGVGYGSPYGSPYGYGSYGGYVSPIGYGTGYGYNPYGYRYGYNPYGYGSSGYGYDPFGRYGMGYGYAPYGWYNDYYYPGNGQYVYDRNQRQRDMTPAEQTYWRGRVAEVLANRIRGGTTTTNGVVTQQAVPSGSVATAPRTTRTRDTVRTRSDQRSAASEQRRAAAQERRAARIEATTARRTTRRDND